MRCLSAFARYLRPLKQGFRKLTRFCFQLLDELQTQAGIDRVVGRLHAYYGHQAARYALGTPFREVCPSASPFVLSRAG